MNPMHVNPIQWQNNVSIARDACARIFRDGGKPQDALTAFGLDGSQPTEWSKVVDVIAASLSSQPMRRAA